MTTRVLMIYPRFSADSFWVYTEACELAGAKYPTAPLGLITVAAMLPASWEVRLVNRNTEDLSPGDLEWADMVMTGGMLFQQADALRLPFRDGSFDAATVAFGIRNVVDGARGIAEMARVVRPGGRVVILEFTLPRNGILRRGYLFYFGRVLPKIGRMIARSEIDAYRYLPDSVARWPQPDELKMQMEQAGLRDVAYELVFGGVAAIHAGTRPLAGGAST